jgi:hypothetical protein
MRKMPAAEVQRPTLTFAAVENIFGFETVDVDVVAGAVPLAV